MNQQVAYYVQVISTLSVLLPLLAGLFNFKGHERSIKGFVFFLFVGLLADLGGWYFYLTKNGESNLYVRHFYDLFESLFLTWFISQWVKGERVRKIFSRMWIALVVLWAVRFFYIDAMSLFKTVTQIIFAFTACFCILQTIESQQRVSRLLFFWILLGIFFYCFCTYFIMGLLVTQLSQVWYSHNLVNITTNLIYFAGFLLSRKLKES